MEALIASWGSTQWIVAMLLAGGSWCGGFVAGLVCARSDEA